ncbi:sensor histidine kinase [Bacteriovorax sp. BSW11_IV]|uniref:sensor histidine kinase n=1 Tax=Bacteriovorax sp. BSW11_IV TaxID=1353529 RepID=UPI0012DE328D|nr:HAMP domain-containing sensor histidine kinase [Bacteriovorax sp. BSW11_IV]
MFLLSQYAVETLNEKISVKKHSIIIGTGLLLYFILSNLTDNFTIYTLPIAITIFSPAADTMIKIMLNEKSTVFHRIMFGILIYTFLNCLTFAFYRMEPGSEFWGWSCAVAAYMAIALTTPFLFISQMQKLKEEVEDQKWFNDNLFNIITHDLKNDLHIIENGLRLAIRSGDQSKLERVQRRLEQVREYQKEIQTIKTLEHTPPRTSELTLVSEALAEVKDKFEDNYVEKNVQLYIFNRLDSEVILTISKNQLVTSILGNLLSNALKFSHENQTVTLIFEEFNNNFIFRITDQGVGMDEKKISELFEVQKNTTTLGTKNEKGSGLGLPILYKIVNANGGRVEVTSKPSNGTCFEIIFPISENNRKLST